MSMKPWKGKVQEGQRERIETRQMEAMCKGRGGAAQRRIYFQRSFLRLVVRSLFSFAFFCSFCFCIVSQIPEISLFSFRRGELESFCENRLILLLFISIVPLFSIGSIGSNGKVRRVFSLFFFFFKEKGYTQFCTHVSDRPLELLGGLPPGQNGRRLRSRALTSSFVFFPRRENLVPSRDFNFQWFHCK